jgi:hypothetical protein
MITFSVALVAIASLKYKGKSYIEEDTFIVTGCIDLVIILIACMFLTDVLK